MLNPPTVSAKAVSSLSSATSIASSSSSSVVSTTSSTGIPAGYQPLPAAVAPTTLQQPNGGAGGNAAASAPGSTSSSANRSSSRRRGGGAPGTGVASSSHVLRTTSAATAAATSSTSGTGASSNSLIGVSHDSSSQKPSSTSGSPSTSNNSSGATSSSILIAPPPRVALGAGNQSTSTVPDTPTGPVGGAGSGNGSGSTAGSGNTGGGSSGAGGSGGGSGGGGASISSSGGGGSSKDTHFVYTANHHNHHQRHQNHHHHHHGHHSISSLASNSSSVSAAAAQASINAAAASAQLVKEKDMRIAQLERELKIMESEFTRELDKLSKAESETATFWQAKHSRLQQQVTQADTEIQLLRAEVELREAERAELRAGWEEMQRAAVARDEEARSLREQVRGLKQWVSTSTRTGSQVASDEVFTDGMARLANGLQNWVIVYFRRAKLASKSARDALAQLVPMYEELRHSAKLHLLQSAVSRILVDLVFDTYFVGLPSEQAAHLAQVESFLESFAGTAEPINEWRALTLAIVSKDAGQHLKTETARVTDEVVTRVNSVLDSVTDAQRSDVRDQALRQLVASALELARLLVAQKAVFRVIMPPIVPHQQVLFDASTMEDIGGEEDDDNGLSQREIACVTFPGIIKRGDETGGHLQYTNVICKARVLCASE
ncbi:hypothetical protein SBRCBS47491_006646 [Sporothrix bragantina]|uniref:Involucrin repeat protein n=1 Tax=Sporothrix bragantina TaxID=671064 RepID=A0ABP0C6M7_9PEZI